MSTAQLFGIIRSLYEQRSSSDPNAAAKYAALLTWSNEKLEIALQNEMSDGWCDIDAAGIQAKARELVALAESGHDVAEILMKGGHES